MRHFEDTWSRTLNASFVKPKIEKARKDELTILATSHGIAGRLNELIKRIIAPAGEI